MSEKIQQKINKIRSELQVDFVALALSTVHEMTNMRTIRWKYVAGNTNQNYQHIRLQVGKGIGGIVWRTGRSYHATNLQQQSEKLVELPITRMEKLETIVAYPVWQSQKVKGVLLVGFRTTTHLTDEFLLAAKNTTNELIAYL